VLSLIMRVIRLLVGCSPCTLGDRKSFPIPSSPSPHLLIGGCQDFYLVQGEELSLINRIYWSEQTSMRTRLLLMIDWVKRGIFGRDLSKF